MKRCKAVPGRNSQRGGRGHVADAEIDEPDRQAFEPRWILQMFTMLTLFLFTAFGIPLVLLAEFWILDRVGFLPRGRRPGLCEKCDYDLTGNESGICPECGTPIAHECARRAETSR